MATVANRYWVVGFTVTLLCTATGCGSTGVNAYLLDRGDVLAAKTRVQGRSRIKTVEPHHEGDAHLCGCWSQTTGHKCDASPADTDEEATISLLLASATEAADASNAATLLSCGKHFDATISGGNSCHVYNVARADAPDGICRIRIVCPRGTLTKGFKKELVLSWNEGASRPAKLSVEGHTTYYWTGPAGVGAIAVIVLWGISQ